MSCKNSNRSQLCCRVLKSERERKREKKMGKGNDGCGMKQAKKKRQQNWNTISNRTADCVKNGC